MEKSITLDEWLQIASGVIGEVAKSIQDDGKISFQEGMSLLVKCLTLIIAAYNN